MKYKEKRAFKTFYILKSYLSEGTQSINRLAITYANVEKIC